MIFHDTWLKFQKHSTSLICKAELVNIWRHFVAKLTISDLTSWDGGGADAGQAGASMLLIVELPMATLIGGGITLVERA